MRFSTTAVSEFNFDKAPFGSEVTIKALAVEYLVKKRGAIWINGTHGLDSYRNKPMEPSGLTGPMVSTATGINQ